MPGSSINSSRLVIRRAASAWMLVAVLLPTVCAHSSQAGMARAQKHESRHEIDQLEVAWKDAILKGNTVAMGALLADDYMAITASGTLQTKEQTLASLKSGRMHFTSLDLSDRKVRFYGATALVTSVAAVQGTTGEGAISGSFRYTRVSVRDQGGAWRIVHFEASKMRDPGEHK
jgi:ketosteroid isomerase-like protein